MSRLNILSHDQADEAVNWNPTAPGKRNIRDSVSSGAYISLLLWMLIYFARPEDWIPSLAVIPLAKIAGVLALIALVPSTSHIFQRLPREVIYLILLTGQLFIAAALSPVWHGGAVQATLTFAKVLPIVIVIALSVRTITRLRLLIFVQALSVAGIAAVTVWKGHQLVGGRLLGFLEGNYSDPNDLALAIVISLPLCLVLIFLHRGWFAKCFWTVAMLMMIYAIFRTGSRGGFIALVVTAGICLWEFGIQRRQYFLLVIAALVGVVVWQSSSDMMRARLAGTFNPTTDDAYGNAQQRRQLLWRSIDVTLEHPLFGVGAGNFQQLSGSWHETHNSFTEVSSEGGLPALILYALILWSGFKNLRTIKRLVRRKREPSLLAKALNATLIGYIVGSLFLSVAFQFFPYFLVAYTTALSSIARRASARSHQYQPAQPVAVDEGLYLDVPASGISAHTL